MCVWSSHCGDGGSEREEKLKRQEEEYQKREKAVWERGCYVVSQPVPAIAIVQHEYNKGQSQNGS